jgi:hypothetical protein
MSGGYERRRDGERKALTLTLSQRERERLLGWL